MTPFHRHTKFLLTLVVFGVVVSFQNSLATPSGDNKLNFSISPQPHRGLKVFLIHGLLCSHAMEFYRSFLQSVGIQNTQIYPDNLPPEIIAKEVIRARNDGFNIAIIGHSQGGYQANKVARKVEEEFRKALSQLQGYESVISKVCQRPGHSRITVSRKDIHIQTIPDYCIDLTVQIASGSHGDLVPNQWGSNGAQKRIPEIVRSHLNLYLEGDNLGTYGDTRDLATTLQPEMSQRGTVILGEPQITNYKISERLNPTHAGILICPGPMIKPETLTVGCLAPTQVKYNSLTCPFACTAIANSLLLLQSNGFVPQLPTTFCNGVGRNQ